jgi:PPOX class probable F420-dependent enzyme
MATLSKAEARFLQEPNVAIVAALREDGTPHQTVVWIDWDGEHVLLNLNTWRAKLAHLRADPRVSVLVLDRHDPYRWLGVEGVVAEITENGANAHIVRQAGVYFGRDSYNFKPGEQRILVRIEPRRVEAHGID